MHSPIISPALAFLGAILFSSTYATQVDSWKWEGSESVLRIDGQTGGRISEWSVGGKTLVKDSSTESPLTLTTADGRALAFVADSTDVPSANQFRLTGHLKDVQGDSIPLTLLYEVLDDGSRLVMSVEPGAVTSDLRVREFTWSQPLALNPRKRAFLLGDHGLGWDERYFYQLTLMPNNWSIMPEPDRLEWRYFGVDQLGPNSVRLWKSESETTAPLVIQAGRYAAPLEQLYDEQGGVTLEYPSLAADAPASLRLDASGGGRLAIQFWPTSVEPTVVSKALGKKRIWTLTAHPSEAAMRADQDSQIQRHASASSPRPDPAKVLDEPVWLTETPLYGGGQMQVNSGYPFAKGELVDVGTIRVAVAGSAVPVQARALAYWPDRSIKWALLTFPIDPARAVATCPSPRVSLRDGRFLPVSISVGGAKTPMVAEALAVDKKPSGEIVILSGKLQTTLTTGTNWLRSLRVDGQDILDPTRGPVRIYSDQLRDPDAVFPFDQKASGGHIDHGVLDVQSAEVEEAGPQRVVVRLEGTTTNVEPLRIVLRLEFAAGQPDIRVTQTTIVRIHDPRKAYIVGLGLELPLAAAYSESAFIGDQSYAGATVASLSRIQDIAAPARVESHDLSDVTTRTADTGEAGVLRVGGTAGGVVAVLRDARQMAPNALTADLSGHLLRVELWPSDVGPMDLRRYSKHLMLGQLESGAPLPASTWVENHYYKKDPVYGISRTHEVLLSFAKASAPVDQLSIAADFESPPLLYAGYDRYAATDVVLPSSMQSDWPRAWDSWTRLTRFFLFHRELYRWYGFWNYGDFRHRMGGFGCIVPPEVLKEMPTGNLIKQRIWDAVRPNDWGYDNGAYGWTNTEGLPGMFLSEEYLRHGNRTVYFAMEAMSRYERDVIVRQEGRWLGYGTRHGVQPWSDGNHEERQTAAIEWRYHYLLTGDGRTRDVIENLWENVYLKGEVDRHASHSGRLPGLLFHWELTGDPSEGDRLRDYVHQFLAPEGIYVSPDVSFPEATKAGAPKLLNSGSQFFHTFGGMHTFEQYYRLTEDPLLRTGIIKMADAVIASGVIERGRWGTGEYSWAPVAFAALHAKDPAPYQDFLRRYIEAEGWRNAYQPVTIDPEHWTGPSAIMTKTVALSLFWANWAPYVTRAIGDEIWNEKIADSFGKYEKTGRGAPANRPSWQSDFDGIPELDVYLGSQQPWRKQ